MKPEDLPKLLTFVMPYGKYKASSIDEVKRNRGIRFEHDANERSGTGHAQPLKNKS